MQKRQSQMFELVLITPERKYTFYIFYKNKFYRKLMNFYLKKNKIFGVHVKDKFCNSLEGKQLYQKGTPTQVFSCEYFELFTESFFIEQLYSFSITKEFMKKKASEEIDCLCFTKTCLQANYHKSICLWTCHLSLNFIVTKHLKEEVDGDLSVCVHESSPCGLSVTGDIKFYQCHLIKEVPYGLLSRSYCPNLITVAPLWLDIKRFAKVT